MIEVEIIGEEKECDDCISRQAAIDVLIALTVYSKKREIVKEADNHPNTWIEGVAECIDEIEDLPSAQPETCLDSIVSEIKKTISETKENGKYHYANIRINGEMMCFGLQLALEIIEEKRNGQSEQPEIIRCKDCEYGEQDEVGRWFCRSLGCQIGNEDGSGFCADAERRTDGKN